MEEVKRLSKRGRPRKISISSGSESSVLSRDLISSNVASDLKPSTVKAVEKKVVVWTPVVIESRFPSQVQPKKVEYRAGDSLCRHEFPSYLKSISGGLIIRLPLTEIEAALKTLIRVDQLKSDEDLIQFIETTINYWRSQRRPINDKTVDIQAVMRSPLFDNLDQQSRQQVAHRLSQISAPTSTQVKKKKDSNGFANRREAKQLAK